MARSELVTLWETLNRPISEVDLIRCHCDEAVDLLECHACGFQFFDPRMAGDEKFYHSLDVGADLYYNKSRPEFKVAITLAKKRGYSTVFDIGCGSGSFLDLAKKSGLETFGLELNTGAADEAGAKGHQIWKALIDDTFASAHRGKYDLVTLFQVMEHVSQPVELLAKASELLTHRGSLMISVPNRQGTYKLFPLDPHQWPPHHVSRWRAEDFKKLATEANLKLESISGDPTHGSDLSDRFNANEAMKKALGEPPSAIPATLVRSIAFLYRKLGFKYAVKNCGTSIYATYSRK